jgi:hypothetical protein
MEKNGKIVKKFLEEENQEKSSEICEFFCFIGILVGILAALSSR